MNFSKKANKRKNQYFQYKVLFLKFNADYNFECSQSMCGIFRKRELRRKQKRKRKTKASQLHLLYFVNVSSCQEQSSVSHHLQNCKIEMLLKRNLGLKECSIEKKPYFAQINLKNSTDILNFIVVILKMQHQPI